MRLAVFGANPGDGHRIWSSARQRHRHREVNSPNDDRLANGPIRRGLGVKMASCSSGERHLKMETFHDL
ncbi:hypothetical protein VZT92_023722 [Zoarces viviparus]|uniref:Uncharacterized protein n=1 Tax=Zoarces viviparus TaxID=48416 RepID=A0AAW1E7G1_ZOAVI